MVQMGGKMKKSVIMFFLLINIILKTETFNEIIIDYGNKDIGRQFKYNFVELTEYKMVISKDQIKYLEPISKDIKISKNDYKQIYKIAENTVKKEKQTNCYDNINSEALVYTEKPINKREPINIKIIINEKEYCMIGKNKLLEYLNDKYDLNVKWYSGTSPKLKIPNFDF